MKKSGLAITFVLPGGNSSGGVRVTVEMANRLKKFGHITRIIYPRGDEPLKNKFKNIYYHILGYKNINWLDNFNGIILQYKDINEIEFKKREIVVAVGVYTINDVLRIKEDIIRVRYNHGFSVGIDELTKQAWGKQPMRTIVVASTLIPKMEGLSGQIVDEVIPNGINYDEYFSENEEEKEGIGMLYSSHPNKSPEMIFKLVEEINKRWPHLSIYMYGAERRPKKLNKTVSYYRYPSISVTRGIYNKCKIWVSVSREEGFCLPILEAMACGCLVISNDNLGVREIITNGVNGYVIPIEQFENFIWHIDKMMKDKERQFKFLEEGRKTVNQFSWEKASLKMDKYIRRISQSSED